MANRFTIASYRHRPMTARQWPADGQDREPPSESRLRRMAVSCIRVANGPHPSEALVRAITFRHQCGCQCVKAVAGVGGPAQPSRNPGPPPGPQAASKPEGAKLSTGSGCDESESYDPVSTQPPPPVAGCDGHRTIT